MFKKQPVSAPARAFLSRSRRAQSVEIETPVGPDSAKREYAIDRKLLEAPVLELSYYVDVAGVVPSEPRAFDREEDDVGNGDTSPEWGLDLVVHGGFLKYGPWADRQRLVPSSYPAEFVLIVSGCIGQNCSPYSFPQHTKKRIGPIAAVLVRIASGLRCEYLSSSAAERRCRSPFARRQR